MAGKDNWGRLKWLCLCECGNKVILPGGDIRSGHTRSCGCLQSEVTAKRNFKHGMSFCRFNNIFRGIQNRCHNASQVKTAKSYFLRGIKNEWKSFEEFRDDMYEEYLKHVELYGEKNTTIDRINSLGNYCKENCRWATIKEQQNNKSSNHFIRLNGVSKTISEWSDFLKIPYSFIKYKTKIGVPLCDIIKQYEISK
jgi:hypothetical protein